MAVAASFMPNVELAAASFIAAIEAEVQQHLDQLAALRKMAAGASSAPAAPAAPAEPAAPAAEAPAFDLAAEIGSAVQEIADHGEKMPSFRFEDLQFGKEYAFTE